MQKEILTMENIQKDMRARLWNQIKWGLIGCPWVWVLALLIGKFCENCGRNVPFWAIHLGALALIVWDILWVAIKLYRIKNEHFIFVRDFVVDKFTQAPRFWNKGMLHAHTPYRLVFAREGKVSIRRNMDFYKWTGCPRSDKTIFDMADMRDMFLLVQMGRATWVVYNEKFFDISGCVSDT